jgi:hypothetical protein
MVGGTLTPQEFVTKWRGVQLSERASVQEHFLDLCALFGQESPATADPTGSWYTFEKGVTKTGGGQGFADVWKRGFFAWEYKKKKRDLAAAYGQLLLYREALENPPLLVVCDTAQYEIHTNFTNTPAHVYRFANDDIAGAEAQGILRALFTAPEGLRPGQTVAQVTEEAARRFATLADGLRGRGAPPDDAAHFLTQLLFCLFAEDVGLLPRDTFTDVVRFGARHPERFIPNVTALFTSMRDGGDFSLREIAHFNGGLFARIAPLALTAAELATLAEATALDWASIEPAIIGTLFERSLDPGKRAQLGAHYTGRADIWRVVGPVVLAPLRREWEALRAALVPQLAAADDAAARATEPGLTYRQQEAARRRRREIQDALAARLRAFKERLAAVRVLDPACGSGNFLTVALGALLDLEKEVVAYGAAAGLAGMFPEVSPRQLYGLEINTYAHELAQVAVWIAYLQWMTANGFQPRRDPILQALDTIRLQDALLDLSDPAHPREAAWPEAEFIIGNPPFLGVRRLRAGLGDNYVDFLFQVYGDGVPHEADFVVYWHEKARAQIAKGNAYRAGLIATQAIRSGANRRILEHAKETGDIFMAWSNEPWVLNGAAVRISIIGYDNGGEQERTLNGLLVSTINADLTSNLDLTTAQQLRENAAVAFQGGIKGGPFDIESPIAHAWLALPANPNGRTNGDVVRPWINGLDITRRPRNMWIVDFGVNMSLEDASLYEAPFEYVLKNVKPERDENRRERRRNLWWIHSETHPAMREAIKKLPRYIATPRVARYRIFTWIERETLPDTRVYAFARDDDYFLGALHSSVHELWSLRFASRHGVGNDPTYNATTCFETFPFPWSPGQEPTSHPRVVAIAEAARRLVELRDRWLDPPDLGEAELKRRTLTALYNARPTWLANAHAALDRAVLDAYGFPHDLADDDLLARLLALNAERAATPIVAAPAPPAEK